MKDNVLEVRHLDYNTKLTFEEAKKRLEEVENAFKRIKQKYLNPEISAEDLKILTDCVGVLLPFGINPVVQREISNSKDISGTLHSKSALLNQDILLFLAKFKNSGVTAFKGNPFGL